jgi:site-specific recombinase XerD
MTPVLRGRRNNGAKSQNVNSGGIGSEHHTRLPAVRPGNTATSLGTTGVKKPEDLDTSGKVRGALAELFTTAQASEAAAALVPWVCDALPSPNSRKAYHDDLRAFVSQMAEISVHPFDVTGDHVRLYKEAMVQAGRRPATIARALSVIRGTYEQFGKKGLVAWNLVGDIQAVTSPRVDKNTTPGLSEREACRLLHAPDTNTVLGVRDHALLFIYFKTACRSRAISRAKVGDLERTDFDWYIVVTEKGSKRQRKPLLEAAPPLLRWLDRAGIRFDDLDAPLFCALAPDKRSPTRRHLSQRAILNIVKKYAIHVGLDADRLGRRGICTHSLRKTALTNALEHGAQMVQVQAWAGHSDIRTTQGYYMTKESDAEAAARHNQIR